MTLLHIHMTVPRKESHACSEERALLFFPLFQAVLYCQLGYRLHFAFCVLGVLFPKTLHTKHTARSSTRFSISPWKLFLLWPGLYHAQSFSGTTMVSLNPSAHVGLPVSSKEYPVAFDLMPTRQRAMHACIFPARESHKGRLNLLPFLIGT